MTGDPTALDLPWQRLSARVVGIDLAVTALSLLPGVVAVGVAGVDPSLGALWPVIAIAALGVAALGVAGGVGDTLRWASTRYRVTDTDIECRTGILVRRRRTLRRDRIRGVDTAAKLRHRIAGMQIVTVGAGQHAGAGEALALDTLSTADAAALRERLLRRADDAAHATAVVWPDATSAHGNGEASGTVEVPATFQHRWVIDNVFSIWEAYQQAFRDDLRNASPTTMEMVVAKVENGRR